MYNNTIGLIIEGLQNSREGAQVSKCVKGISDNEIKNVLSNIAGDSWDKTLDLTSSEFRGMLVDIVGVDNVNGLKVYDIEIKSSKNKPWYPNWTRAFKGIDGHKYNNGYMLTGYASSGDFKKAKSNHEKSLKDSEQFDIDNYKTLVGKKVKIYDYEQGDKFMVSKFSGKNTFTLKYSDGTTKDVDRIYLLSNTDIEDYVD